MTLLTRIVAMTVCALLLSQGPVLAQSARDTSFDLTIPNIMRGHEVVGREPTRVRWTADSRWIYFMWVEAGTDWREPLKPFRVRAVPASRPERVTQAHMDSIAPMLEAGSISRDRRFRAVASDGDVYLLDLRAGTRRRLTETIAAESRPSFASDARTIFFVRDNNVFSIALDDGLVRQLTDVRSGPAPPDSAKAEGQRATLLAQQRTLLEVIRDRVRQDSITSAERKAREAARAKPLFLRKDERVTDLAVAPSGKALLMVLQTAAERSLSARIPNYVTTSGYTEELTVRTKVGDAQPASRVALLSLPSGDVRWLGVIPGDTVNAPSSVQLLGWNDAGSSALLFVESRDHKQRYIHRVDSDSGRLHTLDTLRDSAWVNGPCFGCGGWYAGGTRVWFVSEADGHAHLYTMTPDGGGRRQLTKGAWEVLDVSVSPGERFFQLHTSEQSPFERHFYRMSVNGGPREKITAVTGGHTVVPSPAGDMLADVFSTPNRPPELYLMRNQRGAAMSRLTTSPTAAWMSFPWIVPEIVWIPASDGVKVPARIYRPRDVNARHTGAGVIFVHGAGYLHNVHNYWSTYFREYMFNQLLASKGYVVLDIDYRGSAGYGRDWRTAIYRHMGGRDLQDQVDGSRYLQKEFGIDPERWIYGGSYGGFITLMALFTEPKWFGAGAALRSVTDWAHYNHPYTARILNTPEADTLAFRRSSPIYFAEGLEDPLLIAHGMVDVNVHFQDVVRLSQRLIELGKKDWEMAVYPVEDHGFVRPSSWTDEYRRIFELFERRLNVAGARATTEGR